MILRRVKIDEKSEDDPSSSGFEDIAQMEEIDDDKINSNLKFRFRNQKIYSVNGQILIACNPNRSLSTYDNQSLKNCNDNTQDVHHLHIFTFSKDVLEELIYDDAVERNIIVNGQTASGKSYSVKKIINYYISQNTKPSQTVKIQSLFEASQQLFEAFGTAQTINNKTSSRYRSSTQLFFTSTSKELIGLKFETFLLDKSRVFSNNYEKESNFRVFNDFLYSKHWELFSHNSSKNSFSLLDFSGKNRNFAENSEVSSQLEKVLSSMEILGFEKQLVEAIFRILAAILHLGNIEFESENHYKSRIKSSQGDGTPLSLEKACDLLKISKSELIMALSNKEIIAAKSDTIVAEDNASEYQTYIALNIQQAVARRNLLIQTLYDKLFSFLVSQINISLENFEKTIKSYIPESLGISKNLINDLNNTIDNQDKKDEKKLRIYDIGSFQNNEINGLFELLSNYLSEKLHDLHYELTLQLEQDLYRQQKLEWSAYVEVDPNLVTSRFKRSISLEDIAAHISGKHSDGGAVPVPRPNDPQFEEIGPLLDGLGSSRGLLILLEDATTRNSIATHPTIAHIAHSGLYPLIDTKEITDNDLLAEEGFLDFAADIHLNSEAFIPEEFNNSFVIRHFLGAVRYSIEGLMSTNRPTLTSELNHVMRSSQDPIVQALFPSKKDLNPPSPLTSINKTPFGNKNQNVEKVEKENSEDISKDNLTDNSKEEWVTKQTRDRWLGLMVALKSSPTHHIICIKTNYRQESMQWNNDLVLEQIRYWKMVEFAKHKKHGFNYQISYKRFISRFGTLFRSLNQTKIKKIRNNEWDDLTAADSCRVLWKYLVLHFISNKMVGSSAVVRTRRGSFREFDADVFDEEAQFGKNYLFIRKKETIYAIESYRLQRLKKCAILIQTCYLRYKTHFTLLQLRLEIGIFFSRQYKVRRKDSLFNPFFGNFFHDNLPIDRMDNYSDQIEVEVEVRKSEFRNCLFRIINFYDKDEEVVFIDASSRCQQVIRGAANRVGGYGIPTTNEYKTSETDYNPRQNAGKRGIGAGLNVFENGELWKLERRVLVLTTGAVYILQFLTRSAWDALLLKQGLPPNKPYPGCLLLRRRVPLEVAPETLLRRSEVLEFHTDARLNSPERKLRRSQSSERVNAGLLSVDSTGVLERIHLSRFADNFVILQIKPPRYNTQSKIWNYLQSDTTEAAEKKFKIIQQNYDKKHGPPVHCAITKKPFNIFNRRHRCRISGAGLSNSVVNFKQCLPDYGWGSRSQRISDPFIGLISCDPLEDLVFITPRKTEFVALLSRECQNLNPPATKDLKPIDFTKDSPKRHSSHNSLKPRNSPSSLSKASSFTFSNLKSTGTGLNTLNLMSRLVIDNRVYLRSSDDEEISLTPAYELQFSEENSSINNNNSILSKDSDSMVKDTNRITTLKKSSSGRSASAPRRECHSIADTSSTSTTTRRSTSKKNNFAFRRYSTENSNKMGNGDLYVEDEDNKEENDQHTEVDYVKMRFFDGVMNVTSPTGLSVSNVHMYQTKLNEKIKKLQEKQENRI